MTRKYSFLIQLLLLEFLALKHVTSLNSDCSEPCDLRNCQPVDATTCPGAVLKDNCNCCPVCSNQSLPEARSENATSENSENGGTACSNFECPRFEMCMINIQQLPVCRCPSKLFCKSKPRNPVCSEDGVTYKNACYLKMDECTQKQNIRVARKGPCESRKEGRVGRRGDRRLLKLQRKQERIQKRIEGLQSNQPRLSKKERKQQRKSLKKAERQQKRLERKQLRAERREQNNQPQMNPEGLQPDHNGDVVEEVEEIVGNLGNETNDYEEIGPEEPTEEDAESELMAQERKAMRRAERKKERKAERREKRLEKKAERKMRRQELREQRGLSGIGEADDLAEMQADQAFASQDLSTLQQERAARKFFRQQRKKLQRKQKRKERRQQRRKGQLESTRNNQNI